MNLTAPDYVVPSAQPPTSGRFITTDAVVLAVNVQLNRLPERGAATTAHNATSSAGGGFTLLSVAAAQGVSAHLAAPLGTGPNSFLVRRQLAAAGINTLTDVFVGDIGVSIVFVEEDGHNTIIRTRGVEAEPTLAGMESISLHPGDIVHISGADLAGPHADALVEWGAQLPPEVTLVLAVSPAVHEIAADVWMRLLPRTDVLTMNIRESNYLSRYLGQAIPGTGIRHVLRDDAALVRRLGAMGCEVQETAQSETTVLPAYPSERVDTTGLGDTHVAVMCSSLLQGQSLLESCRRANAAAAIMIAREGAQEVPTPEEIDQIIAGGNPGAE